MNESGDQQQQQRAGSSVNPKIASDSGYGSNKSTQRSSGSSKSHESSVSSESSTAYPPHPDAPVSSAECQSHNVASPSQGGSGTKRQSKKKSKGDRKQSIGEKPEGTQTQSMDQSGSNMSSSSNLPNGPHSQQQASQIMSPGSKTSSTHDSKALQMAALTHALSCMKKFHKPMADSEINEENEEIGTTSGKNWQEYFANDIKVDDSGNEDTLACVVSMEDGIIAYITPSIANILGFPKDMLEGRSFIDFVHPKDRIAFASHITCGMSFPMSEQQQQQHSPQSQGPTAKPTGAARVKSEPFYCRLRQYRGLKTVGFGVVDKTVLYYPFKLSMTLKKVEQPQKQETVGGGGGPGADVQSSMHKEGSSGGRNEEDASNKASSPTSVNLVIVANRIKSAYQFSDEIPSNPGKFVTRHSASCHFGHMDSDAINYLGHLPQDLIGNSVLDYYHPDDMGLMKDIYEGVMQEQGKPFRSKPYRFRVYNGTFAMLETDWSCFINPWSWKLEFVIGQHRVIKGPGNPNVFMQPTDDADSKGKSTEPDEMLGEAKEFQNEIKRLLTETVTRRLSDPLRQQSSRRRKGLAALMESLLEGMAKTETSDKSGSQCSGMFSVMERDSVMLGEISPHHDDQSGSNQSSETPPSYNQLNYRENIERFFQSRPKTVRSDESTEMETNSKANKTPSAKRSSDSDSKSSPNLDYSSGSNVRLSSGSVSNENENESGDNRETCASPLTEERLSRHNEAMEKYMIQRHRELRGKSSMTPGSHKESRHRHSEKVYTPFPVASSTSLSNDNDKCSYYIKLARCQRRTKCKHRATAEIPHGLKRTGNASWDGDNTHTAKQPHLECLPGRNPPLPTGPGAPPGACCAGHGHNSINLWPPFSITMTPGITTSTYRSAGAAGVATGVGASANASYHTNFPGLPQCFNPNTTPGRDHPPGSGKVPEAMSMSATTPNAPLLFVPSHHHQFVPQQVQLFPAGVVYQPMGSCIYGQPSPIMMPAGFLSTMMHPQQGQPIVSASQGEAIGTATLPKLSEKDKRGRSSTRCKYDMMKSNNYTNNGLSTKTVPVPGSAGPNRNGVGYGGPNGRHINYSGVANKPSGSACQQNSNISNIIMGNEGSGSDESMNSSFLNQSISDADQDSQAWSIQREEGEPTSEGTNNKASGTPRPVRNKNPPWLENVQMTSDLMYRYRIPAGDLSDVLQKDLEALKLFGKQSTMVNDQLEMLYRELKLDGNFSNTLNLEEGAISNSSSGDDNNAKEGGSEPRKSKKPVASHQYSKMVILYEENAPFPPESDTSPAKTEEEV